MKSTAIVSLFLERKDRFGVVGLSRKQVSWLCDQLQSECKSGDFWRDRRHPISVFDVDGNAYHFVVYPQGGGFIKPQTKVDSLGDKIDAKQASLEAAAKLREAGHAWAADEIEKAVQNGIY